MKDVYLHYDFITNKYFKLTIENMKKIIYVLMMLVIFITASSCSKEETFESNKQLVYNELKAKFIKDGWTVDIEYPEETYCTFFRDDKVQPINYTKFIMSCVDSLIVTKEDPEVILYNGGNYCTINYRNIKKPNMKQINVFNNPTTLGINIK